MNYKNVFKYTLEKGVPTKVPTKSKLVLFGMQDGHPVVWLEVKPYSPTEHRLLTVYPTGLSIPLDSQHVASVQDGGYVWHLYEDVA